MTTLDLAPLWRSTVGFDRLFDLLADSGRWTGADNYPPYDIERVGEDHYQITLALAGFPPDTVSITAGQNTLTVEGRKADKSGHQYLYQGISARPFRQIFNLAEVRASEGRLVREWHAQDRSGSGGSRGDETAPDCDQHRC
ncbi:HSP20 family molecular chaperone IbpA [Bradyrhizobium elkanii]